MLKEPRNNPSIGEVVTTKLLSGEEIVGKLAERTLDSVFLTKPVLIAMQQLASNKVGLAFMPVLGSVETDATIQIPFSAMAVRPLKTGEDVRKNYAFATTSLLTPPTEGLITP